MYNQLFHTKPTIELIITCLQNLGYTGINDRSSLSRSAMHDYGAVYRFSMTIPQLLNVYIPCKFETFCMKSLDIYACITITRQLLKTIDYDLVGKECVISGVRMQRYELMTIGAKKIRKRAVAPEHKQQPIIVSFD